MTNNFEQTFGTFLPERSENVHWDDCVIIHLNSQFSSESVKLIILLNIKDASHMNAIGSLVSCDQW